MVRQFITIGYICLIGVITFGSTSSFAVTSSCSDTSGYPMNGCSLPGQTSEDNFPFSYQAVSVKYKQKKNSDDFRVKAGFTKGSVDSLLYLTPEDVLDITKTKFRLDAIVSGDQVRGKLNIKGKIDSLGIKGTLMTADLADFNWGNDGTLIGFDTMNIKCNKAFNAMGGCTTSGAIYLNLLDAIGPEAGARKIKTDGTAVTSVPLPVTSVPLPAAVWLFGSGLLGLIGVTHRRGSRAEG